MGVIHAITKWYHQWWMATFRPPPPPNEGSSTLCLKLDCAHLCSALGIHYLVIINVVRQRRYLLDLCSKICVALPICRLERHGPRASRCVAGSGFTQGEAALGFRRDGKRLFQRRSEHLTADGGAIPHVLGNRGVGAYWLLKKKLGSAISARASASASQFWRDQ